MKATSARVSMITILAPLPTTMKSSIKTQVLTLMTLAQSLPVTALGPINDGSRECYHVNWSYINLAQLQSTEDVCVVNKVILFQVLYYVLAKQDSKVEYTNRSGKTSHATFERMLFAMDLHARKGMNVCVFLLGKKQNAEIYSSCLDQRDTSTFGKNYIHVSWLLSLQSKSNHVYR